MTQGSAIQDLRPILKPGPQGSTMLPASPSPDQIPGLNPGRDKTASGANRRFDSHYGTAIPVPGQGGVRFVNDDPTLNLARPAPTQVGFVPSADEYSRRAGNLSSSVRQNRDTARAAHRNIDDTLDQIAQMPPGPQRDATVKKWISFMDTEAPQHSKYLRRELAARGWNPDSDLMSSVRP